jgi:predicted transcriptional regulator
MPAARSDLTQVKACVDERLHGDLVRLAHDGDRSLAAEVRRALREYVASREVDVAEAEQADDRR